MLLLFLVRHVLPPAVLHSAKGRAQLYKTCWQISLCQTCSFRLVLEEKKKFDKETEKNYSLIDKHLTLSAKKKDSHLQEADLQVEQTRQHFYELSLEYVCKLQEIQERKKFEFVEPMLSFFQGMFTFYHQGHELSKDFNHYKMELQINIQNTRNRFEGTRSEVEELMNKIRQNPKDHKRASQFTAEGYLYVQEKRPAPFGSSWVKHYCMYRKTAKKFNMIPFEHRSGGKLGDGEVFFLKECTRRYTNSIDRRFCFDIEAADRPGIPLTVQAFSEEERKQWLEALGGTEALFHTLNRAILPRPEGGAQLDTMGFTILRKCISAVETRVRHVLPPAVLHSAKGRAQPYKTCWQISLCQTCSFCLVLERNMESTQQNVYCTRYSFFMTATKS
ncbi:rho GTPase-activating protein 10-like isoform X3 [Peromyscus maniculatus bairdii]|uniref:rho GTPase-activating protein 10-like isoform X3 n=1 Tax=Peromyscus maniculatus bairdii TaxID=230844 RepID=UPI003FD37AF4